MPVDAGLLERQISGGGGYRMRSKMHAWTLPSPAQALGRTSPRLAGGTRVPGEGSKLTT